MHLNLFTGLLAMTPPPANGQPVQPTNMLMSFAPMILLVVVFYFILIRPQQQRAKQQQKLLSTLKSGDRVSTASGLVGVVISVKDKAVPPTVSLRSADAKFEVLKSSVTEILESSTATAVIES